MEKLSWSKAVCSDTDQSSMSETRISNLIANKIKEQYKFLTQIGHVDNHLITNKRLDGWTYQFVIDHQSGSLITIWRYYFSSKNKVIKNSCPLHTNNERDEVNISENIHDKLKKRVWESVLKKLSKKFKILFD
jgi:hypothetical protein